jgi:hypothetical protein
MMRIDVDFNERDRLGHVVTRVPAAVASQLAVGQRVNLYDPPEKLWADAVVARINDETRIAAFDVDWHSFEDAEVTDVLDAHAQWSIGVPPTEGHHQLPNVWACSVSDVRRAGFVLTGTLIAGGLRIIIAKSGASSELTSLDDVGGLTGQDQRAAAQ